MKRFQELLIKDIGWKLLSVAIAAIMWFMVINIDQPVDTRNYSRPIALENLEILTNRGLTIANAEELKNTKVLVKVKAQRTSLDRLNQNPDWIQASIDFSELTDISSGETASLQVNVVMQNGLSGYSIISKSPGTLDVDVELLTSKELPIEVVLHGELEDGVYLSEPKLSRETVIVSGPLSAVEQVTAIRANVNAAELQLKDTIKAPLAAYDAEDVLVKGVSLSAQEITISYALQDMKQVPIQIEIIGTPAAGCQVGTVTSSPKYAEVTGSAEVLRNLLYLQLDPIDVTGCSSSLVRTFTLEEYLPEGVFLKNGSTSAVNVEVEILSTKNSKTLTLDETNLTLQGQESGKSYTFDTAEITVTGDTAALQGLTSHNLHGILHVNGLEEGEHRIMVHIDLPDGLSALPAYINVTISGETQTPEAE